MADPHHLSYDALVPWLEAAAVLDVFVPPRLVVSPSGSPPVADLEDLSTRVPGGGLRLARSVREEMLAELMATDRYAAVRRVNEPPAGSVRQGMLDAWLAGRPYDLTRATAHELRIALQVAGWLAAVPGAETPPLPVLRARLQRLELLRAYGHVGGALRYRSRHRRRLLRFAENAEERLCVHGVGGAGKSALIGWFLLHLSEDRQVVPLALDLDDARLDPARPWTLDVEFVRLLAGWCPAHARDLERASTILRQKQTGDSSRLESVAVPLPTEVEATIRRAMADRRLVLVLDTFEVAQRMGLHVQGALLGRAMRLVSLVPGAKLIVSGRVPLEGWPTLRVGALSSRNAASFLRALVDRQLSTDACAEIVGRFGRLPLTVHLQARALRQRPAGLQALERSLSRDGLALDELSEPLSQGFLYLRILQHIEGDQTLQRVALSTLLLPAFDEQLLAEALPHALQVPEARVRAAFADLQEHPEFVKPLQGTDGWLRHRDDLREAMSPLLDRALARDHIDRGEIIERARAAVGARSAEVPAAILPLFRGGAQTVTQPTTSSLLEVSSLVEAGRHREALDHLREGLEPVRSPEGAFLFARALHGVGHLADAKVRGRDAVDKATFDGQTGRAVDMAEWCLDHLGDPKPAERLAASRTLTPLDALRLTGARAAARQRAGAALEPAELGALQSRLTTTQVSTERLPPELYVRLAGLLGGHDRDAVTNALARVGLRDAQPGEFDALADVIGDSVRLRGGRDLISLFGVSDYPEWLDNPERAWRRALEDLGTKDLAPRLERALELGGMGDEVYDAIGRIYAGRDARRLRPASVAAGGGGRLRGIQALLERSFDEDELYSVLYRFVGPEGVSRGFTSSRTLSQALRRMEAESRVHDFLAHLRDTSRSEALAEQLGKFIEET